MPGQPLPGAKLMSQLPVGRQPQSTPKGSALAEASKLLERNRRYAESMCVTPWQYAVLGSTLEALSLEESDIGPLIVAGYLERALETTLVGGGMRHFRPHSDAAPDPRTCFILTEAGLLLAREVLGARDMQSTRAGYHRDGTRTVANCVSARCS